MKKTLAIALALVCCLGLLAACGEPASDPSEALSLIHISEPTRH